MPDTPNGLAIQQLVEGAQKSVANVLMWLAMAVVGAAPIAIQQIHANRGPGSVEYLNPTDFQIIGPDLVKPGLLVRLTVQDYSPTNVRWFTANDAQNYGPNGAELVFAMPEEDMVVVCSIIRNGELYLTQKTIHADRPSEPSPQPQPEPDPEPTPEPEPEQPVLTPVGVAIIKLATDANLKPDLAIQVANNLRTAANDPEVQNPRSLVIATVELNQGINLPEEVSQGIQVLLQTLAENGELTNLNTHKDIWDQMASGFEAYAE